MSPQPPPVTPAGAPTPRPPQPLERLHLVAAGLDIGAEEIWVCVPADRAAHPVRSFGTYTPDLEALVAWLAACGVTTVAMEATGVYWIPIYDLIEAHGITACLVNARTTKNVSGRKSDLLDCQWIQQLHSYGLLQPSFRPPPDIVTLRTYVRQREQLLAQRTSQVQHMQKALHQMNLKLTSVLTDITGLTGQQIIRAIIAGEHDPVKLAQFRNSRCKSPQEEIAKALTGNYCAEHLFALQQAVATYDFFTELLAQCDTELEARYACFEPFGELVAQPAPAKPHRHQANQPHFDLRSQLHAFLGVDLTAIPGVDVLIAQDIIAEVGVDMSKWKTEKQFGAWLGLAPNNKSSAGKILSRHSKHTTNRAAKALRLAAQSVSRSQSALGVFYRRMRALHGPAAAITATAHKIARIIYHMLKEHVPYCEPGAAQYTAQQEQRAIRHLEKQAQKFGLCLTKAVQPAVS